MEKKFWTFREGEERAWAEHGGGKKTLKGKEKEIQDLKDGLR